MIFRLQLHLIKELFLRCFCGMIRLSESIKLRKNQNLKETVMVLQFKENLIDELNPKCKCFEIRALQLRSRRAAWTL